MLKKILLLGLFLTLGGNVAWGASSPVACRKAAAERVLEDLNRNGELWELRLVKNGGVAIMVKGKVWLELADEELYTCNSFLFDRGLCVEYEFEDPETRRVEHVVMMELSDRGCTLREYKNLVGARPWR